MTEDPSAALRSAAAAVTGPETPEAATVTSTPTGWAVRMLALAGPALSAMVAWIIAVLGSGLVIFGFAIIRPTLWPDAVAPDRIRGLTWIGLALCAILGIVVFRLASGGLKRVEAKAGPAEISVSTGD